MPDIDKSKFYLPDGSPYYGIFKEILLNGQFWKGTLDPVYTIQEEDNELPSAHRIYMESMNEYDAAMKLVPSWKFWTDMLQHSVKIKRQVEAWREEKMLRDQAKAKQMLWDQAEKGNIQAQRLLYESKKEEAEIRRQEKDNEYKWAKEKDTLETAYNKISTLKSVK